jgi:hypothetical protein
VIEVVVELVVVVVDGGTAALELLVVVEVLLVAVGVAVTITVVGERDVVVEDVVGMSVVTAVEAFGWAPVKTKAKVATPRSTKMTMAAPAVVPFMTLQFMARRSNTLTQVGARTILEGRFRLVCLIIALFGPFPCIIARQGADEGLKSRPRLLWLR